MCVCVCVCVRIIRNVATNRPPQQSKRRPLPLLSAAFNCNKMGVPQIVVSQQFLQEERQKKAARAARFAAEAAAAAAAPAVVPVRRIAWVSVRSELKHRIVWLATPC